MKKILIFSVLFLLTISQADAGLFEYYMGQQSTTNASKAESVDAVETIQYSKLNNTVKQPSYSSSKYNYPSSSYSNLSKSTIYDWTYGNFRQSRSYYPNNIYDYNGFYKCDDLTRNLDDELQNLERESDYIDDIIDDLEDKLRETKKYTTSYYRDVRRQLENDIENLEERADYIDDLRNDIKKEIRDTKDDCRYKSSGYYYNYYGNSYYDTQYDYDSYFNYNSYNRGNNTYIKYENDSYYSEYQPWVNTNLKPVKDGRIYIK